MKHIVPADVLHIGLEYEGPHLSFPYRIDDLFSGSVRVSYPFAVGEKSSDLLPSIGLSMAAFLGQLCLARRIILDFPCSSRMVERMLPIVEMLYDIRCWRDDLDIMPLPELVTMHPSFTPSPFTAGASKQACLLWAGGKDSTLSSILLKKNGFTVHPVHVSINTGAEDAERGAIERLAEVLGITYQTIDFDFPQYRAVSEQYAILWDIFPDYNIVPFGRDLILALLATPIAQQYGDAYLCLGHEHGSRTNYFYYKGKRIARDDVESIMGGQLIEAYLQEFVSPTIKFFPPVAGLSEFRILHELFTKYPDVLPHISFCFWGDPCGRCSKCLRYYLVQRVLEREDLLHFPVNPLEGDQCPDLRHSLDYWCVENGRSYTDIVLYCLSLLVAKGDVRPGEPLVERFATEIYPLVKDKVGAMEKRMMMIYPDPQVPADFCID